MIAGHTWSSINCFFIAISSLVLLPLLKAHVSQPCPLLSILRGKMCCQKPKLKGALQLPLLLIERCQCLERFWSSRILTNHLHTHTLCCIRVTLGKSEAGYKKSFTTLIINAAPEICFPHEALEGRVKAPPPYAAWPLFLSPQLRLLCVFQFRLKAFHAPLSLTNTQPRLRRVCPRGTATNSTTTLRMEILMSKDI